MKKQYRLKAKENICTYSYQKRSTAFAKAVNMVGGLGVMGKILGVTRQTIWYRVNRSKSHILTISECKLIEKATMGEITPKMLRSDF